MFDYEKFENDILNAMESDFKKYVKIHKDIYAVALDCTRDMSSIGFVANTKKYLSEQADEDSEDYWYYKYCEEEWEIFDHFQTISDYMNKYLEDSPNKFTNPKTYKFTTEFDSHCNKIIDTCIKALAIFKQVHLDKDHSYVLVTFNIREYLDEEKKITYCEKINGKEAAKEYRKYINEFV